MAGEHALGASRLLAVYVVSALAGSVASVIAGPGPSVGASGAIFGVMGAVILILFRYRNVYHVRDKRIGVVLAGWAGFVILTGLADPMIDNAAHLGGLVGGVLAASRMRPRFPAPRPLRR
jgi:membrane associated rhomboid family serine protease